VVFDLYTERRVYQTLFVCGSVRWRFLFLDFVSVIYLFIFGSFIYIPFLFRNSNPNLSEKWMDVLKEIWGFFYICSFLLEDQISPVFSMYV